MARIKFILLPLLIVAGCAPSPLYVGSTRVRGTVGEVPRDGHGEPMWSLIRPAAPAGQAPPAAPPQ